MTASGAYHLCPRSFCSGLIVGTVFCWFLIRLTPDGDIYGEEEQEQAWIVKDVFFWMLWKILPSKREDGSTGAWRTDTRPM